METFIDKKFYVPNISEFHIGFEYWLKSKEPTSTKRVPIIIKNFSDVQDAIRCFASDDIVVKHLSKEDIESFGFVCVGIGEYQKLEDDTNDFITVDTNFVDDLNVRICYEKSTGENVSTEYTMFDGTIKNKSEFKKLLIQLNIINE